MPFLTTPLEGVQVFEPRVFKDDRGYFYESYNKNTFTEAGITCEFVQDNQSFSEYGTVRGIHLQLGDYAQAKLVRVIQGEVLDVAVDLRAGSKTFGQHFAIHLSADNHKQLFIPRGFGHGFSVLSPTAIFSYKCDNYYHKEAEAGVIFNDQELNIDWKIPLNSAIVSQKDKELPSLSNFKTDILKL